MVIKEKKLLALLTGKNIKEDMAPPIWMMRQAGRYLPEYQNSRKQVGGFLEMCDSPAFATEVTCQPIHRYGFDGAIIFADILLLPRALGQHVWFEGGVGPKLTPLPSFEGEDIRTLEILRDYTSEEFHKNLAPVYQALQQTRAALPAETTLLGFCGAPWTVFCYMFNGAGSKDWANVKAQAYKTPEKVKEVLTFLAHRSAEYLAKQVESGAEAVQVFDSWAGAVPPALEDLLLKQPLKILMQKFKELCPNTPLILFPKGVSPSLLEYFAQMEEVTALAVDEKVDLNWAAKVLAPHAIVQGNLDNALLLTTPAQVKKATEEMLAKIAPTGRYIVNLGHGVLPPTPLENVATFVKTVKEWQG